jgi:hypothetical protein
MNSEQRKQVIQSFLKESLKPEHELKQAEISGSQFRQCGARGFNTYVLKDGSEWVMGQGGLNRFLGHVYLKKAIEHYGLETLRVVETRYAYKNPNSDITINIHTNGQDKLKNIPVIDSKDFFSLSLYVGDNRPKEVGDKENEELEILRTKIGFTDMTFYANLRKYEGKIYIIDTEYGSFSSPYDPYFDNNGALTFTFPK